MRLRTSESVLAAAGEPQAVQAKRNQSAEGRPCAQPRRDDLCPSSLRCEYYYPSRQNACPHCNSMLAQLYTHRRRQASVSPKADTVEELQSRRKRLHVGMAKLAYDDLHRQVVQVQADAQVRNGLQRPFRKWVAGRAMSPRGRLPPCVQVGDEMRSKGMPWVLRQEDVDKVRQHRFRRS